MHRWSRWCLVGTLGLTLLATGSGGTVSASQPARPGDSGQEAGETAERITPPVDYSGVIAAMRDEIPKILANTGTVGATVALVDRNQVVWTQGFGLADKATGRSVTADTLFHIGSLSKTFTAVAVMQLVQRGKVKLDAPLARYVPEFRLLPRYRNNVITHVVPRIGSIPLQKLQPEDLDTFYAHLLRDG
ncbi:MAG: serine hydrolase domain-containing protein, partial [Actinomycetes bacterium]